MPDSKVSQSVDKPCVEQGAVVSKTSAAKTGEAARVHAYLQGWRFLKKNGITASQFIEFLRPLADLDGIEVTHVYQSAPESSPERTESALQQDRQFAATEKVLSFGLNKEGRVLIQSNFIDLK